MHAQIFALIKSSLANAKTDLISLRGWSCQDQCLKVLQS